MATNPIGGVGTPPPYSGGKPPGPPTPPPQPALSVITSISPTTALGIMIPLGTLCATLAASTGLPPKVRTIAGAVGAVLGVMVGIVGKKQGDAGRQLALTPDASGSFVGATPQLVPSVELPVNPAAIPVVEGSSPAPSTFQPPTK